jgi:O-antigen/teichoic acid export membrane protein
MLVNIIWNISGKAVFLGAQFLLVVFLTKKTDLHTVGYYTYALSIAAPIFLLSGFHGKMMLAIETSAHKSFNDYFFSRLLTCLIASFVLFAVFIFKFYENDYLLIPLVVVLMKIIESLVELNHGLFQNTGNMKEIGVSQMIRGAIILGSFILMFFLFNNVVSAFIGMFVVSLFVYLSSDLLRNNVYHLVSFRSISAKKIFKVIKKGLPLGLVLMLGSISNYIPVYILEYQLGIEFVGIFSALLFLTQSATILMSSIWETLISRLKNYRDNESIMEFKNLISKVSIFGFFTGLIGVLVAYLWGRKILNLIYNEDISNYYQVFCLLMIVLMLRFIGGIWSVAVTVLNFHKIQVVINAFSSFLLLISCYFFIPEYGLTGAAYSILISTFITRLVFYILYQHCIRRGFQSC